MILGIDPGATGALALLDRGTGDLVDVWDMPSVIRRIGGHDRPRVCAAQVADRMKGIKGNHRVRVVGIEEVGPSISARASFAFGRAAGVVEAAALCVMPSALLLFVTPQRWKTHFALLRADKSASRDLATKFWPLHARLFERVKDDGRAEAALIARYFLDTL